MSDKKVGIELLKIISLCGVIALHTQRSYILGVLYNPILYYLSRFCMPVFFMINGYLILSKQDFTRSYYLRKIKNIFRILLIWSTIAFFYSYFLCHNSLLQSAVNFANCLIGRYIVPFWFFISFLIIYTILLFYYKQIKKNIWKILISLCILMALADILSLLLISYDYYFIQSILPQFLRMWTWFFYFCLGYAISKIVISKTYRKILFVFFILTTVYSFFYQYLLCYRLLGQMNSEYCYDNILIMIWSALIFYFLYDFQPGEKGSRFIILFNSNMFGVFLLHGFIIKYWGLTEMVSNMWESSLLFIGVILLCWVVTYLLKFIPYLKTIFVY